MPDTIYTAEGLLFIQGANVSVIGPNLTDSFGDPGTQLIWTNALPSASNFSLTDVDGDQQLVVGVDDFGGSSFTFTGYTATAGGVDYPIFSNGSNFYIALDADPFVSGGWVPAAPRTSIRARSAAGTSTSASPRERQLQPRPAKPWSRRFRRATRC